MTIELNHTIVHARDKRASAEFLARILDLTVEPQWGPFIPVSTSNGVSLDYMDDPGEFTAQHYAFLVSEAEFDAAFARLRDARVQIWADPHQTEPGEINHHYGGRGVYFEDPDGHLLEIITTPYGSDSR